VFQESEIVDLVLAIGLTPIMYASVRRLKIAGKTSFVVAYLLMVGAYVFTVAETVVAPEVLNLLEHGCLAGAGLLFVHGIWRLFRGPHEEAAA
jgi:hypothetical protein